MSSESRFTIEDAKAVGEKLGIDWKSFDIEQFRMGVNVELEHGLRDPDTNVTDDDVVMTSKIAWAHLKEFPDYYERLEAMEQGAEIYWDAKRSDGSH